MSAAQSTGTTGPLGFARAISWSALLLLMASGLVVSIIVANSARKTLLTKQQDFALLVARNLNHQVYRRFTLPTLIAYGRIALRQPTQYDQLDQVIDSTLQGLNLLEVRIYDNEKVVSYSTDPTMVGKSDLADAAVELALKQLKPSHNIQTRHSALWSMFQFEPRPGSVVLKTTYPLTVVPDEKDRIEKSLQDLPIMGILEIYQDITGDYRTVVNFQWLIIATSLFTSLVAFLLLHMIIRRADRMNAERIKEKENLERELHQNEKLASMGRMIAGIAHEIRNPLGIIRSSAELLMNRPANKDDPQQRIMRAIYDESKRLSQTVNEFLDYARPKQPKMDFVDLSRILDQALVFLENDLARREITLERLYPAKGLAVAGDRDLLYRAVYNVLVNAIQAVDSKGSITLRVAVSEEHVSLIIEDSGPGFVSDSLDKALDPFTTTKSDGTGLGLPIVDTIVKAHKGRVRLENRDRGGARVTLSFPHPTP